MTDTRERLSERRRDGGDGGLGLYIHIPFCKQKCLYCDFCSYPHKTGQEQNAYIRTLVREMEAFAPLCRERTVDTVYIGGGTPTLLCAEDFSLVCETVKRCFALSYDVEWTVEANPGTVTPAYLAMMRQCGVNRLSIGAQSFHDGELNALGRIHSAEQIRECVLAARAVGFENISLDLMYGIPLQTAESFVGTLKAAIRLSPAHLSVYGLIMEEGTPFYRKRDGLILPDEDMEYEMYLIANRTLSEAGYRQYEVSNYAREGCHSRHNYRYWTLREYLGFGVSSHSFFGGRRFYREGDLAAYLALEGPALTEENPLALFMRDLQNEPASESEQDALEEYVMLRLRLAEGIEEAAFSARFGFSFSERYGAVLAKYRRAGLLAERDGRVALNCPGLYLGNRLTADILYGG